MIDISCMAFLGVLIIVMSGIQILLMIVKDIKIWSKLDRIVNFFGNEKESLRRTVDSIKRSIDDLNRELIKIKESIDKNKC